MGNPQHLEWLLEGVQAWNARRERENFEPDFEGVEIRRAFERVGKLVRSDRIPLEHVNLMKANLKGADLMEALLEEANLWGANLGGAALTGADLREADLWGAFLRKTDLVGADLKGSILMRADVGEAILRDADIRTVWENPFAPSPKFVDLSHTKHLTQEQLDTMKGDTGVILPEGLVHPAHWPDPQPREPELPDQEDPSDLGEKNGKLSLSDLAAPARQDLEDMQQDLREDVVRFRAAGGLHNVSVDLDSVVIRFAGIVDRAYGEMDQIRFGVQASALRKRFEGESDEIKQIDPAKHGALDAILMVAELLSSRLPKYQAFLAETLKDRAIVEDHAEEVGDALEEATDAFAADPEHFDGSLTERLQEYWTTKTTEAYLAGTTLLNDAAFVVFRTVRDFTRETGSESRKIAVKGLAKALVYGLGSVLAKLAGLMPAEFEWILPWLKYIPTIFG